MVVAESHVGLSRGSGDRILNRCDAATSSLKCRFETSFLRLIPDLAGCSRLEAATKVSNVETGHSPRLPRVASRFQLFESHRSNPSTCRKGNRKNKYFSTCLLPAFLGEFGSLRVLKMSSIWICNCLMNRVIFLSRAGSARCRLASVRFPPVEIPGFFSQISTQFYR